MTPSASFLHVSDFNALFPREYNAYMTRNWIAVALLALVSLANAETVHVGAAVSLKEALGEIAKTYEADGGDKIEFVFGSSGQVATQIKNGAEIDVFISAANEQVDDLIKANVAAADSRRVIAGNELVLIVPAKAEKSPTGFAALADPAVGKIAVGEPKSVPAGKYAAQVFKSLSLDTTLADRLVYGANVRQVLTYVEKGEVAAGVVYLTDARESGDKVKVVAIAEANTHEPIVYPAVVISATKHREAAGKFLEHLTSEKAQAALAARGFKPAKG